MRSITIPVTVDVEIEIGTDAANDGSVEPQYDHDSLLTATAAAILQAALDAYETSLPDVYIGAVDNARTGTAWKS